MRDLEFALKRVRSGDKVRFHHDFYGRQWVELKRAWFWPSTRVRLTAGEIVQLKAALDARRRAPRRAADESPSPATAAGPPQVH